MLMEALGQINNAEPPSIIDELPPNCLWFEGGLKTQWLGKTDGTETQWDGGPAQVCVRGRTSRVRRSPRSVFDSDSFMAPSLSTESLLSITNLGTVVQITT